MISESSLSFYLYTCIHDNWITRILLPTCFRGCFHHCSLKPAFRDGESSRRNDHIPSRVLTTRLSDDLGYSIPCPAAAAMMQINTAVLDVANLAADWGAMLYFTEWSQQSWVSRLTSPETNQCLMSLMNQPVHSMQLSTKTHMEKYHERSSGAVWKSRWPSWAFCP